MPAEEATIAKPKKKMGRPSEYTPERGADIAEMYANGASLAKIEATPGMPTAKTIRRWRKNHEAFDLVLAHARKAKAEWAAERAGQELDIDLDQVEAKKASATVTHAKNRSEYYKWLAARLDPDGWGESQRVDLKAQVMTLTAFADMARPEGKGSATDAATEVVLEYVAAPDGADRQ